MAENLFDALPPSKREAKRRQPSWAAPMTAKVSRKPFSRAGWLYERKLDGERCLAFRNGKKVRLLSRNRKALNGTYPELVDALERQPCEHFIVDGEIVAFEGGRTSFGRLQQRFGIHDPAVARRSGIAVYYYLFDMLHLEGYDLTEVALRHRKSLLKRALSFHDPLRYNAHRAGRGEEYYEAACRKGWEGIMAKRADGPYLHSRSGEWLKFKCSNRQEFVIGGYTDPQGGRIGFGALLIGYYRGKRLIYAGKVGTGFNDALLRDLTARLEKIERRAPAFDSGDLPSRRVHWVAPELVGEVVFTEWTSDGSLRHPSFLGLREDKDAGEVTREMP